LGELDSSAIFRLQEALSRPDPESP